MNEQIDDTGEDGQSWEKSLDATLDEIVERDPEAAEAVESRADRARDEHGRFAPKPAAKPGEVEAPSVVDDIGAPEVKDDIAVQWKPSSWKAEELKDWEALPPSAKAAVERREREIQRGFEQIAERSRVAQTFEQTIQPYMPVLQQTGVHPVAAVQEALQFVSILNAGSPEQRANAIARLAQRYGVQLGGDAQQQQPGDPFIQATQAELVDMRNRLQAFEYERQQQAAATAAAEQQSMLSTIDTFKTNKPDFDTLRPVIAMELRNGAASLDEAYTAARSKVQALFASQHASEAAARAAQARKASAVNVTTRGAPTVQPPKAKSWEEGLAQVAADVFHN